MKTIALLCFAAMAPVACASARPEPAPVADAGQPAALGGKQLFETVCVGCHTVQPPPAQAPPMAHVIRHYRARFGTREAVVERVVAWLAAPARDRSVMPAHMLERWGVMPPVALDDAQRRAVAEYVWTLGAQPHHGVDPGAAAHGHHRHSGGSR